MKYFDHKRTNQAQGKVWSCGGWGSNQVPTYLSQSLPATVLNRHSPASFLFSWSINTSFFDQEIVPNASSKVPNASSKVSNARSKVPNASSSKVPNASSKVPFVDLLLAISLMQTTLCCLMLHKFPHCVSSLNINKMCREWYPANICSDLNEWGNVCQVFKAHKVLTYDQRHDARRLFA